MNIKQKIYNKIRDILNVNAWVSIKDVYMFVFVHIFLFTAFCCIMSYFMFLALNGYNLFIMVHNMPAEQRSVWLFLLVFPFLFSLASAAIFTYFYKEIIFKPVFDLMIKMRQMGENELTEYLINGKLSNPFRDPKSNERWYDIVQAYVDTASVDKYIDELTGCFNRKYIEQRLNTIISTVELANKNGFAHKEITKYGNEIFAVFLIDIDHFKSVNDTYGHDMGDKVLRQVGSVLRNVIGSNGVVIRFGGEEFVVVVSAKYPYDFSKTAELINQSFRDNIFVRDDDNKVLREVTCSVGFVEYPFYKEAKISVERHVKLADYAMYKSKVYGRDQWHQLVAANVPYSTDEIKEFTGNPSLGIVKGYCKLRSSEEEKQRPAMKAEEKKEAEDSKSILDAKKNTIIEKEEKTSKNDVVPTKLVNKSPFGKKTDK